VKRIFSILLLLLLVFTLSACGADAETLDTINLQEQEVNVSETPQEDESNDQDEVVQQAQASNEPTPTESIILLHENILRDFNSITQDMSLDDINSLLGSLALLEFESEFIRIYYWVYTGSHYLEVSFGVWDGRLELVNKRIDFGGEEQSIFIDSTADLSKALYLLERMENHERISYDEFVEIFGSPGVLIDVSWADLVEDGTSSRFHWQDGEGWGRRVVAASFVNGYAISISVGTL